jgi:DNA modification methylase
MDAAIQLSFLEGSENANVIVESAGYGSKREDLGTFKDSLRAPVHRWFTYPAGFSYKAVEEAFRMYDIKPGMIVYDPFGGTATTNIVASQQGIHSYGVEAHPFIHFVGRTKLFWNFAPAEMLRQIDALVESIKISLREGNIAAINVETIFPELVCKCYSREKLAYLYICREVIRFLPPSPFQDFAKLGLTSLLRTLADVQTGWPYIAPKKERRTVAEKGNVDVVEKLRDQLYQMYSDIQEIRRDRRFIGDAHFIFGDSRCRQGSIESASVDIVFTSPPYLNNYDYSDRTRLEMYFWGEAKSWGDITQKVRSRLIMSATTQVLRSEYVEGKLLRADFIDSVPAIATELQAKIADLTQRRLQKGGKKSYDIMVAGYFNDMLNVFRETFRVLKPGGSFLLILGDSAPYGVHIPTDIYLGEVGKAVGFARYKVEDLRTRGDKWKDNPQRHKVALKESMLILEKE